MTARPVRTIAILCGVVAVAGLPFLVGSPAPADPFYATENEAASSEAVARHVQAGDVQRVSLDENERCDDGYYGAPIGTQMTFAVDAELGNELIRKESGETADGGHITVDADLEITVLDRRDDELMAAIRFPRVDLGSAHAVGAAGERLDALGTALARPTLARIDTAGRVAGLQFPEEFDYFARSHVRVLLANFRFVVPKNAATGWTVQDVDETGVFEAVYAWQPGRADADPRTVERRRTKYLTLSGARNGAVCEVSVDSRATAVLSREQGWLVSAEVDERVITSLGGIEVDVRTTFRGTLAMTNSRRVALADQPEAVWDGAWSAGAGDPAEASAIVEGHQLEQWRKKLDGVAFGDLVDWLAALVASGQDDGEEYNTTWEEISWMVRLDPAALSQLTDQIQNAHFDEKTASGLLTSIGNAGTPEAQAALASIQSNEALTESVRMAAVVGLVQAEAPTAAALDALHSTATGPRADQDLGRTSLLVFGALAARSGARMAKGESVLDRLLALEQQSRDRGTITSWLTALGNSGLPQIVERVAPYFGDTDPNVREAAAMALRQVVTQRALELLLTCVAIDTSSRVRSRAAESLADHGTERARATLRDLVLRDIDADVRRTAMVCLSQNLDAAARAALRHAAEHDAREELRRVAAELLRA